MNTEHVYAFLEHRIGSEEGPEKEKEIEVKRKHLNLNTCDNVADDDAKRIHKINT